MFVIRPLEDRETLRQLYQENDLVFGDDSFGVLSREEDRQAGFCLFSMRGDRMEILYLEYPLGDVLMGDTLLRAAMNYAANRNVYSVICRLKEHETLLRGLTLVETDGVFFSTLPEVFAGCGNCKNNRK